MLKAIDVRPVMFLTGCAEPSDFALEPEEMICFPAALGLFTEPPDCPSRTIHFLRIYAAGIPVVEGLRPLPAEAEGARRRMDPLLPVSRGRGEIRGLMHKAVHFTDRRHFALLRTQFGHRR